MGLHLIIVGLLGGLLGLDRRAALQMMISNPLVAGLIIGTWLGEPLTGIQVGALTALLWIHELPVGAVIPPNDTVIAVAGTFLTVMVTSQSAIPVSAAAVIALLWVIPFGVLALRLDAMARRWNIAVSRWVINSPDGARGEMLVRAQGVGLLTAFTGDSLCTWLAVGLGMMGLPAVAGHLPERVIKGLNLVFYLLPLVGVAAGIATINRRRAWWTVVGIFVVFNVVSRL